MRVDLKLRKYLAEMCLNDFTRWVREVGKPIEEDACLIENWVMYYLLERYDTSEGKRND